LWDQALATVPFASGIIFKTKPYDGPESFLHKGTQAVHRNGNKKEWSCDRSKPEPTQKEEMSKFVVKRLLKTDVREFDY
jgi:hypothetical protein